MPIENTTNQTAPCTGEKSTRTVHKPIIGQCRKINITKLKDFALSSLDNHQTLRDLILSEPDELSPNEFLVKCDVWLKLLKRRS